MRTVLAIALSTMLFAGCANAGGDTMLKNEKDKVSYSIGLNIGSNFKSQSVDSNPDILIKGIKDAMSGSKLLMTDKEIQETLTAFQKELTAKQAGCQRRLLKQTKKMESPFLLQTK